MAMASSGGYGSRSYGYSTQVVTKTYSLEDAIEKAGGGVLSPGNVFSQLPGPVVEVVENISKDLFSCSFASLTLTQQCEVMRTLHEVIQQSKKDEHEPVSVKQALEMARSGSLASDVFFDALPEEARQALDQMAVGVGGNSFRAADAGTRKQVLDMLSEMLEEQASAGAVSPGAQQVRDAENEDKRRAEQADARTKAKQCSLCGGRLSLFDRICRRRNHRGCTIWKD